MKQRRLQVVVGRISGFALSTIIAGAVSAVTIPILIMSAGVETWTAVVVGQSFGAIGNVIIGFGWAVSGTAAVSAMTAEQAKHELKTSFLLRGLLVPPTIVVLSVAAASASPNDPVLAGACAAAFSLNGLTAGWYFIGRRTPAPLIRRETIPRAAITLVGLGLVMLTGLVLLFPAFLALGTLAGAVMVVVRTVDPARVRLREVLAARAEYRRQFLAVLTSIVSTAYLNVPTVLISVIAPQQLAVFALADRLFKLVGVGISPMVQVIQGWIPARPGHELLGRIRSGIRLSTMLGIAVGIGYAVAAPILGSLFSGGRVGLPVGVTSVFGATLLLTVVSQVVGLSCLVALGRIGAVARSALLGAVVGVPVVAGGALVLGAPGAAIGQAAAEFAVTAYQLGVVRSELRRRSVGAPQGRPRESE